MKKEKKFKDSEPLKARKVSNNEVDFSEKLFSEYKTSEFINWLQNAIDNEAVLLNAMWDIDAVNSLQDEGKFIPVDNETLVIIEEMANIMTENNPRFIATPVEDSDGEKSDYYSMLFEHIHTISKGNQQVKRMVMDLLTTGKCVALDYVDSDADYGRGEVKWKAFDPKFHLVSPHSKEVDCSDSIHHLLIAYLNKDMVSMNFPQIDINTLRGNNSDYIPRAKYIATENQQIGQVQKNEPHFLMIERYTDVIKDVYHIYDVKGTYDKVFATKEEYKEELDRDVLLVVRPNGLEYITNETDISYQLGFMEEYGLDQTQGFYHLMIDLESNQQVPVAGTEYGNEYAIPNTTTQMVKTTVGGLVKDKMFTTETLKQKRIKRVLSLGGQLISTEILDRETKPCKVRMLHHQRTPYAMGDVTLLRPHNERLNALESIIMTHASNTANISIITPLENTKLADDLRNELGKPGTKIIPADLSMGAPVPLVVQAMANELYLESDRIKQQMRNIVGITGLQIGDTRSMPRTQGATLSLLEEGRKKGRQKQELIEDLLNDLAYGIAELIPKIYRREKVIRLTKPNDESIVTTINQPRQYGDIEEILNNVVTKKYDIRLQSGSMLPSNRQAKMQMYIEMKQYGIQGLDEHIIRNADIPNAEEIIAKNDRVAQLEDYIAQLEDKMKSLSGDMETLQRENLHNKQRVEVEKFKSGLYEINSDVKANQKIAQTKLKEVQ